MAEQTESGMDANTARASSGRGLAALALFVGLAALGGAAYLYVAVVMRGAGDGERIAALESANESLVQEVRRLDQRRQTAIEALRDSREAAFAAFRTEQEGRRRAAEEALAESLQRVAAQSATAPAQAPLAGWQLAEAEYILRIANRRMLVDRDFRTALDLLKSADAIFRDLDDFTLFEVRATLAREIRSLEQAPQVNISDIYLRLDTIKRHLSSLSLALPKFEPGTRKTTAEPPTTQASAAAADNLPAHTQEQSPQATVSATDSAATPANALADETATSPGGQDLSASANDADFASADSRSDSADGGTGGSGDGDSGGGNNGSGGDIDGNGGDSTDSNHNGGDGDGDGSSLWKSFVGELGSLVRFRHIDIGFTPPPAPTEAAYLELNLRLMLEQAQLAALRVDQRVYAASLDRALEWANAHLDHQVPEARETIAALAELRGLRLDAPAPDISGSLVQLRELRQHTQ